MIPPPDLLATAWFPFILNFYWRVVGLFFAFPRIALTSWFRTVEANRLEGGDEDSQHLFALAMDLRVPLDIVPNLMTRGRQMGLVMVQERNHVHVQAFPAGALARAGVRFPR